MLDAKSVRWWMIDGARVPYCDSAIAVSAVILARADAPFTTKTSGFPMFSATSTVRATDLTEEFSLETFMEHHGQAATPLLMRRSGERTVPLTQAGESSPGAGDTLFYLAPESPMEKNP